ncbi:putative nuclease HARBI1 [Papilio machaon]|uniref:putative nuclease HARBI1 n=1 Tax=Papilio machaon TaxID=76193 RepID=UPI001E663F91|nr:putative nuclease HARBI1 [Papilio machaon]
MLSLLRSRRVPLYYYVLSELIENIDNEVRDTREITRKTLNRRRFNLLNLSDIEFKNRFRLSKSASKFLCAELRQKTSIKSTKRISLEEKVLCALSFYATGSYQRLVGEGKYLGQTTVSKYVREVTDALTTPELINYFIKFPITRSQRDLIKKKFYTKFGIPGTIGCVDGSHFHIFSPSSEIEHHFYCRKHFYSLNVQMICDSDCRILNVNAKYGGATHDAFIWENSDANKFMQELYRNNEQVWLLGDSGYPQRPRLMLPPVTDAVEGSPEAVYTTVHGKARVVIENTFGRLKNRWRCLSKDRTLHYNPERCAAIIMACCVLHNLAIDFSVPDTEVEVVEQSTNTSEVALQECDGDDLLRGRTFRNILIDKISRLHNV